MGRKPAEKEIAKEQLVQQANLSTAFKAIKNLEDDIDDGAVFKSTKTKIDVIGSGSPALDDIMFCGGYPRGRIVQLYGPFGGGKTLLAMIAAKQVLDADKTAIVIWFDAEHSFDFKWAEILGVWNHELYNEETGEDENRLRVFTLNSGIKIFEKISGVIRKVKKGGGMTESKKIKPGILDLVINKELNCPLIVIDSLAAIQPPGEDSAQIGAASMALLARFLPVEFRRLCDPLVKANICLMCINQVVQSFEEYGDPLVHTGGEKLKHWISMSIFCKPRGDKDSALLLSDKDKNTLIGRKIELITKKNRFGPYPRAAETTLLFAKGLGYDHIGVVDVEREWIHLGLDYKAIAQSASWYVVLDENKFQGEDKIVEWLKENPTQFEKLKAKIAENKKIVDNPKPKHNALASVMADSEEETEDE